MSARKFLTPEQKISIIREHLIEKVPVSELCDRHGVSVVNFYNWQKQLFENGAAAFQRKTNSANAKRQDNANAAKRKRTERPAQHFVGGGARARRGPLAQETASCVTHSGLLGFVAALHFTVDPNRLGVTHLPYVR